MNIKTLAAPLFSNDSIAFSLRWNWGGVLLFALLWSYGFEGATLYNSPIKSLLLMGFLVFAITKINQVGEQYKSIYQESFSFTRLDALVLALYSSFLISLTVFFTYKLHFSLVGDQLFHALTSQNQSMKIADYLISKFKIPETIEYKIIVRLVSCTILGVMIFLIKYIRQYELNDRTTLIVLLFFILKFLPHYGGDTHPPFRLFPLWISSALFGLNDLSFRLASLLALSIFAFTIYKLCQKHFSKLNAFLMGLAIATIPLLLHVGSMAEPSIWVALSWSLILILIMESSQPPNYVRWISIVVIASLMRAPAFVALVPILAMMFVEYIKEKDFKNTHKYFIYATPILILIPFLWIEKSMGTPATSGQLSPISQIISSFENGFSIKVMYYSIQMPWVLFLPFCLFPINRNLRTSFMYAVFFLAAYIIFYSIRPVLWGVPRYQSELWLPFVIFGFYNAIIMVNSCGGIKKIFVTSGLVILVLFNSIFVTHLNWINQSVDDWTDYFAEVKTGKIKIWSEGVYNYDETLAAVRAAGYSNNTCIVGITYGTFSEVMNGYSIGEMASSRANYSACGSGQALSVSRVNNDKNIKLILFADKPNKANEINLLIDSGRWVEWRKFYNNQYGSTIVGLIRK